MKLALVLAFCVALASARLPGFEEWSWTDDMESYPTTCHVSSRKVKTFDNEKLPIVLPNCYTVLVKDCSSDPKFVVMMRKLSPSSDLKEIKILTRTHKVVLTPSTHDDNIRVIVNGQERPLMEDLLLKIRGFPIIRIIKEGQQQVKVESLIHGLKLRFDGFVCDIKLPETSYNKKCGLCGLSNLGLTSGFRNTDFLSTVFDTNDFMTTTPIMRNLFVKYITSDCRYSESDNEFYGKRSSSLFWPETDDEMCTDEMTCPNKLWTNKWLSDDWFQQSPRLYSHENTLFSDDFFQTPRLYSDEIYGDDSQDFFSYENKYTTIGKRPILKHKIVEREDEVCVSLKRIPQCPLNSYPVQKIEKRVPYVCVHRSDPRVHKVETRILLGERIPEIQRLIPSLTRTEIIPIKCNPFY